MLHLLKWRYQPSGRGNSQRLSIADARNEIADLLEDSPSLSANLDSAMASAYRDAHRKAAIETELAEETFPAQSPWTFLEAANESFWPDQADGRNSPSLSLGAFCEAKASKDAPEVSGGAARPGIVLRGRFAAPQDEVS